jgi:hypothetical protein
LRPFILSWNGDRSYDARIKVMIPLAEVPRMDPQCYMLCLLGELHQIMMEPYA